MEPIIYALYSISAGDINPQNVLVPGTTLKDAYLKSLEVCNTTADPNAASLDMLIWAMQKDPDTGELVHKYDYTIEGAYKYLQQTEIARAAKIEQEAVVEDGLPPLYFKGSFYELIGILNSISTKWDETQPDKKVLTTGSSTLTWYETTGLLIAYNISEGTEALLLEEVVKDLLREAGYKVDTDVVEEEPEAVIPSTSIAPWTISSKEYPDAFGINDSDNNLIALVVNNHITGEHAETNARLMAMSPELEHLTMDIFHSILNKLEDSRTMHENDFIHGIVELFGEEDMQVDVHSIGVDERLILLTFVENYIDMHDTINMLRQHGTLTPEIMQDLTDAQKIAQESLADVRTQLL